MHLISKIFKKTLKFRDWEARNCPIDLYFWAIFSYGESELCTFEHVRI